MAVQLIFVLPILLVAGLFYADWKWVGPRPHVVSM